MPVHLSRNGRKPRLDGAALRRYVRAILAGEGMAGAGVGLRLTDDAELHALNARHRGRDRPTDVLAFPHGEDGHLGDVVVSLERAAGQAPRFHNTFEAELARLVAHGLLHLLGYDHHAPADGRRMKQAERRALAHYRPGSFLVPERRS